MDRLGGSPYLPTPKSTESSLLLFFELHGFYQQAALFTTNQEFQQYLQKIIPSQTQSQWNQNTLFKVPLAQQEQVSRGKATYWAENNFNLWTTNTNTENHSAPISSIQNGFLLQSSIYQLFNDYLISVNPDGNYKITCFIPDDFGLDGRILDPKHEGSWGAFMGT
ncbi:hypothetical protein DTO045G8_1668 [Paecilomyces variotii]|nr:hypothetical protein DTO045G8_1668 [Paecilomyces variotii]